MTNQASELFELCKKVYEKTGWKQEQDISFLYRYWDNYDELCVISIEEADDTLVPAYTSDYLLEKLASDYSIEATVRYVSHDTKDSLYRCLIDKLGKFVAFTPDTPMGTYPVGDKPVIPLLKLTIALSEAGELK